MKIRSYYWAVGNDRWSGQSINGFWCPDTQITTEALEMGFVSLSWIFGLGNCGLKILFFDAQGILSEIVFCDWEAGIVAQAFGRWCNWCWTVGNDREQQRPIVITYNDLQEGFIDFDIRPLTPSIAPET